MKLLILPFLIGASRANYEKTPDGFKFNFDKFDLKIDAKGTLSEEGLWSKTFKYNFDSDISIPPIEYIDQLKQGSEHNIDLDAEFVVGLKPTGGYKLKMVHANEFWWSHELKFQPLSYSTKNFLNTDLRFISNYTDNGLMAYFFGYDQNTIDSFKIENFKKNHVFDILLDTSKAGETTGCNSHNDFYSTKDGDLKTIQLDVKDKCVFQTDFVLNDDTLLQIQIINYPQYKQFKFRLPSNGNALYTFRIIDNDELAEISGHKISDSQKHSYEVFYRSGIKKFELFMTIPKTARFDNAKKILQKTFNWVETLEWASLLHVETYNSILQEENFDLQPAIDEINFIVWEPFRTNFFQVMLGNMYEDLSEYLSFEYLTQVIKIVMKNIINELEEPSEEVKKFLQILTENGDVAKELIDKIFEL